MLTEAQAHIAYNILVLHAGADPTLRDNFVFYVTRPTGAGNHEFRFQGSLGYGGKFYLCQQEGHAHGYIGCYREDETPERWSIIERCNALLALLEA